MCAALALVAACGGKSNDRAGAPLGGMSGAVGQAGSSATEPGSSSGGGRVGSDSDGVGSATPSASGFTSSDAGAPQSGGTMSMDAGGDVGVGVAGAQPGASGDGPECFDVCAREGGACCFTGAECVSESGRCRIDVLAETVSIPQDYAQLEVAVAKLSPDLLVSLTDTDVKRALAGSAPASRIELELTDAASVQAQALDGSSLHPFRVSCDDRSLFLGVTYIDYGAAAISAPVMHVTRYEHGNTRIRLGAWQGAWALSGLPSDAVDMKERLDRPELRAALCRDGVLEQL